MIGNNNKAIIKKITNKSIKANKTRNIFIILAIVLTTFMISSVFSIGFSFMKNYQTMTTRMNGTTSTIALKNPTDNQLNKLKELKFLRHIGTKISAGNIVDDNLSKNESSIGLSYSDEVNYKNQTLPAISDVVGKYPTKENEIMASKWALKQLGIDNPEVGMNIDMKYKLNGKVKSEKFTLSGYYKEYTSVSNSSEVLVSKKFIEKNSLSLEENGYALMDVKFLSSKEIYNSLDNDFPLNKGQKFDYLDDPRENSMSAGMGVASLVGLISVFIIISGYLLIYNVLYIGVSKDISFYGLLKTIGTSPSQIKKIVKGQAIKLSFIGIAIGLILGGIVSFFIVPFALSMLQTGGYGGAMPSDVSFNPLIFIGAGLFSLLTTVLSCRKPAKVASSISPVEALRFIGGKGKKLKKNSRKSRNSGKVYKMAWYNVFRDKKRAIIVFLSLFMGIVTFLSVDTFVSSMGIDNYMKRYVPHDFNIESSPQVPGNLGENLVEKIKKINGVEKVEESLTTKFQLNYEEWFTAFIKNDLSSMGNKVSSSPEEIAKTFKDKTESLAIDIIGLDDSVIEKWNKENKNPISIEDFKAGKTALYTNGFPVLPEYEKEITSLIGKTISGKDVKSGIEKSYELVGNPKVAELTVPGLRAIGVPVIYVSNTAIKELTSKAVIGHVNIDVNSENEPYVKQQINNLIKDNPSYKLNSKSTILEEFKSSMNVMSILGGGMGIILVLIGILNFINIMVTSINIRMKELAVMESVGMTKKFKAITKP